MGEHQWRYWSQMESKFVTVLQKKIRDASNYLASHRGLVLLPSGNAKFSLHPESTVCISRESCSLLRCSTKLHHDAANLEWCQFCNPLENSVLKKESRLSLFASREIL